MIKRPLVWIILAYLTGLYLAWNKISFYLVLLGMLCSLLLIYLFMYHIYNKYMNCKDIFVWCLPFIMVLGFLSTSSQLKLPELYDQFDQEVVAQLTGEISMIADKQWGRAIYVHDCIVELTIDESQQRNGSQQTNESPQSNKIQQADLPKQTKKINQSSIPQHIKTSYLCENIIIYTTDDQTYQIGNRITVLGTLQKFSKATNTGQFNEQFYYLIENIDFKMEAEKITIIDTRYSNYHVLLDSLKQKFISVYDTLLNEKEAGALIAMLLGEKYLLNEEIKYLYQVNGISHVLAISGLHISLIGMFIFWLLRKCKLSITWATILTVFFIYSYGILTNFSVSTNRAIVMMVVLLFSTIVGKTYDTLSAMSLSAFIILLQNPLQIFSAGFILSFGAMLGIAVIYPCLQQLFESKNPVVSSLLISVSTQITTIPFVIFFYYQIPVYSVITNLIILPFITILTLSSILAGIAGLIYVPLGVFLIGGSNYILKFYEEICKIGVNLPGNQLIVGKPDSLRIIIYIALILIFVWGVKHYNKKYFLLLPMFSFVILILPRQNVGLEVTFLDVGQGDSIYMESDTGTTYLVDGGSSDVMKVGKYRLQPFLLSQGTDHLDYAIITHSDNDHISGMIELMENDIVGIKCLVLPFVAEKDEAYIRMEDLAKKKGIEIVYLQKGDVLSDGKLRIFCLHPSSEFQPSSSNAYSTVLSVTYGEFNMLLTGDLPGEEEQLVMDSLKNYSVWDKYQDRPALEYEVLKVAHHGSKYSTFNEFLQFINPRISIVSCGLKNRYGHPHAELLDRLELVESDIKITYETGAFRIRTDGEYIEMESYLSKE